MRVFRVFVILVATCLAGLYFRTFLPTQLDPDFIVYGQSQGSIPCTTCPLIRSIVPSNVTTGTSQGTTINGMNLGIGSLNAVVSGTGVSAVIGTERTTTTAGVTFSANADALLGARLLTLTNMSGSSGSFCCLLVKSVSPGPVLDSITPTIAAEDASAVNITLNGSGFDPGSKVRVNGVHINGLNITPVFVNSSELQAQIPAGPLTMAGLLGITVINPGPTTSDFKVFTVRPSTVPFVSGIVPRGLSPNTVTSGFLIGANLLGASSIVVDGSGVALSVESGGTNSEIPVSIDVMSNAPIGPRTATVMTPAGSSTSPVGHFVIATEGRWAFTEPLQMYRDRPTATLLPSGKVVIAGTHIRGEIYDPATTTWTFTNFMNELRTDGHRATLLSNGKVLIAGSRPMVNQPSPSSSELYDPAHDVFELTGSMNQGRHSHSATILKDGKVLVAGGFVLGSTVTNTAELYDPASGIWTATGNLNIGRAVHTATLLPDGKVLVAGGRGVSTYWNQTEIYDPATGLWTLANQMNGSRGYHTATLLSNGHVLVVGGFAEGISLGTIELYNPASGIWTNGRPMSAGRNLHTATLMPGGNVLIVGGSTSVVGAELYDPAADSWKIIMPPHMTITDHSATLLLNGQVLIAGGFNRGPFSAIATRISQIFDNVTKKVRGQVIAH